MGTTHDFHKDRRIIVTALFLSVVLLYFGYKFVALTAVVNNQQANIATLESEKKDVAVQLINEKSKNENLYNILIIIDPKTDEDAILGFEDSIKRDYDIQTLERSQTEESGESYIIINVSLKSKNNEEMKQIYYEIKSKVPNLLNIDSTYL